MVKNKAHADILPNHRIRCMYLKNKPFSKKFVVFNLIALETSKSLLLIM